MVTCIVVSSISVIFSLCKAFYTFITAVSLITKTKSNKQNIILTYFHRITSCVKKITVFQISICSTLNLYVIPGMPGWFLNYFIHFWNHSVVLTHKCMFSGLCVWKTVFAAFNCPVDWWVEVVTCWSWWYHFHKEQEVNLTMVISVLCSVGVIGSTEIHHQRTKRSLCVWSPVNKQVILKKQVCWTLVEPLGTDTEPTPLSCVL